MAMWRQVQEFLWIAAGVCLLMLAVVCALAMPIYLAIGIVNAVWRGGSMAGTVPVALLMLLFGGICGAASLAIRRHLRKPIADRGKPARGFEVMVAGDPPTADSPPVSRDAV